MKSNNVVLHNAWDSEESKGLPGMRLSRLPLNILPDVNDGVQQRTFLTAGCEIRGLLPPGGKATIVLSVDDDNIIPPLAETYFGGMRGMTTLLGPDPTEIAIERPPNHEIMAKIHRDKGLPFSPDLVRLRLPHLHTCRIISIEGDLTPPPASATPELTMLSYGSSITNGAHALRPSGTYTAQTAKNLGVDVICLGFGGSAHMDVPIAAHIAARTDWDFATLEMGINVRSWTVERFRKAVEAFVATIVTGQPHKYLFCIDLFTFLDDFTENTTVSEGFRKAIRYIVDNQRSSKVIYVDGRDILTDPSGLRWDLVHPSDDGMAEMGWRLAKVIGKHVNPKR